MGLNFKKVLNKTGGRNNDGRITRNSGGKASTKRKYRFLDLKKIIKNQIGYIKRIEIDPYRSAFIALIYYQNGFCCYSIATENLKIGSIICNYTVDKEVSYKNLLSGNSFSISSLPTGSLVNNIELIPTFGSCLVRAAGTSAKIVKKYNDNYMQIKLKSGEQRLIYNNCLVTLGIVSNINHHLRKLRKAGQSRWLGIRPHVRGRAKNPVDHPHGGRTNGGTHPKTPNGQLTKGQPTRFCLRTQRFIIVDRRKKF